MLTAMLAATLASPPEAVDLTIYNGGFGLVRENRTINLRQGTQEIAISDVAEMIEANSVLVKSLTDPNGFSVLEQNYQFDLISPIAVLNKAVGKKITFVRTLPDGRKEHLTGTLVSAPTQIVSGRDGSGSMTWNGMVIQTDDGRVILNPSGEIEVDSIPEGLISKPTLVWLLEAAKAGTHTVELSYLTQGMSWQSDYVIALDKDGKIGDLKGWVTLTNMSGATYNARTLKLLAGEVNRVQPQRPGAGYGGMAREAMTAAADNRFVEEAFSEYHLYTLQRPTVVRNRETKQVSLLEAFRVPVTRKIIVDPMRPYFGYRPSREGQVGVGNIKPLVQIQFTNDEKSHLGMPLPEGTVKIYQHDSSGALQLLGEDRITHTPRNELVTLKMGHAFDIVAERRRISFEFIDRNSSRGSREVFEVKVRNRKETPERVYVWERHWGDHKITQTTHPQAALDSQIHEFILDLQPNEEKVIQYTVETYW